MRYVSVYFRFYGSRHACTYDRMSIDNAVRRVTSLRRRVQADAAVAWY